MNGEDAAWPPPPNDELRFEVGSRVECCVGKDHWEPGTVVALWYTEEGSAGLLRPVPGRAGHGQFNISRRTTATGALGSASLETPERRTARDVVLLLTWDIVEDRGDGVAFVLECSTLASRNLPPVNRGVRSWLGIVRAATRACIRHAHVSTACQLVPSTALYIKLPPDAVEQPTMRRLAIASPRRIALQVLDYGPGRNHDLVEVGTDSVYVDFDEAVTLVTPTVECHLRLSQRQGPQLRRRCARGRCEEGCSEASK